MRMKVSFLFWLQFVTVCRSTVLVYRDGELVEEEVYNEDDGISTQERSYANIPQARQLAEPTQKRTTVSYVPPTKTDTPASSSGGSMLQRLRKSMWVRMEKKEDTIESITSNIAAIEQSIANFKDEQRNLKMKIMESKSCQELNVDKSSHKLSCNKGGQHNLYNGVMSMFGLPSQFEWLSLHYVPFDWSIFFALFSFISGLIYANALLIYGDDIVKLFESVSAATKITN